MAQACYNGEDPLKDDQAARIRIWKWAKANGIDQGLPYEKVHDAINQHFYGGMAKPQWIMEHLSGRKTPFREISDELWRTRNNRRAIVNQAQEAARYYNMGPIRRALSQVYNFPRSASVMFHGAAFPAVHAGRLTMQPARWGMYFKSLADAVRSIPPNSGKAFNERLMGSIKANPNYDLYTRGGLDMQSVMHAQPEYIRGLPFLGKVTEVSHAMGARGWDALLALRFNLMDNVMQRWLKPGMTSDEQLALAKAIAPGVNHATGSAKMPIVAKYADVPGRLLFGPKLLAAKLASLTTDPAQALRTGARIATGQSDYAERTAFYQALSGSAQFVATSLATLAANTAYNQVFNTGQKVNLTDPTKSDWLKYKVGGMEFEAPGLMPEIREIGKQIAIETMDPKTIRQEFHGQTKEGAIWKSFWDDWLAYKAHPAISAGYSVYQGLTGQKVPPWYAGQDKKMDWWKFAVSQGLPMSFSGAGGFFYDQLRKGDLSQDTAIKIMQGAVMQGLGLFGIPVRPDYGMQKEAAQRAGVAHTLQAR